MCPLRAHAGFPTLGLEVIGESVAFVSHGGTESAVI
jgi:hypothetical protein